MTALLPLATSLLQGCSGGNRQGSTPVSQDSSAELQEIVQAFAPWRESHRRDAWRPIVESRAAKVAESKFGGVPYLGRDEEWPKCAGCRRPLQLLLQLDLQSLPESSVAHADHELLQLF